MKPGNNKPKPVNLNEEKDRRERLKHLKSKIAEKEEEERKSGMSEAELYDEAEEDMSGTSILNDIAELEGLSESTEIEQGSKEPAKALVKISITSMDNYLSQKLQQTINSKNKRIFYLGHIKRITGFNKIKIVESDKNNKMKNDLVLFVKCPLFELKDYGSTIEVISLNKDKYFGMLGVIKYIQSKMAYHKKLKDTSLEIKTEYQYYLPVFNACLILNMRPLFSSQATKALKDVKRFIFKNPA